MLLSKKIKLEVSEQDAATLEFMQSKSRGSYNWWIMKLRDGGQWSLAEAKQSLQASKHHDPELKYVYGKLLHEVYYRIDNAMQAFFRRVKVGETPGFPRVRPRHCFFTLCYPAMYIKIKGNKLILPTGGGGKHGPKRNKQRDSLHKASHLIAHKLVASTVVVGELSQRQMVMKQHEERNKHLHRAVFNDWGLYLFVQMLRYKCPLYGKELVFLDERDTSKMCSRCGNKQAMPLYKRTYRCDTCGLVMDRDENSAVNILKRYLARLGPHTPRECGVLHGSCSNQDGKCLNTF